MIRQAPRLLVRSSISRHTLPTRRFLSTAPPAQKSRSWKSLTLRVGLVVGAIYYYNTSQLFAEEPPFSIPPPQEPTEETSLQTLESIAQKNRTPPPSTPSLVPSPRSEKQNANSAPPSTSTPAIASPSENGSASPIPSPTTSSPSTTSPNPSSLDQTPSTSPALSATEEEASQEGAFNEETGEINWDCPCLGGMAHGPCGEQFREAFSCFVFSKEEPKGMDCIPNFKNMQDCFREHPDVYGAELDDDEDPEAEEAQVPVSVEGGEVPAASVSTSAAPASSTPPSASSETVGGTTQQGSADEGSVLVPKAAHDARDANTEK